MTTGRSYNMYFSYGHESGLEFHETAEQAKARAEEEFGYDQDEAPDGWHDEVEHTFWGEVRQKVVETGRRPTRPEDTVSYDEVVEYALKDVDAVLTKPGEAR